MIVCPNCREVNEEGVGTCTRCGRSLDPGPTLMLSRPDAGADRSPIHIEAPKRGRPWPAIVLVGVLLATAAGFGVWTVLRPNPCEGTNFTSDNFGYCLTVPEGWTAEPARLGPNVELDQFSLPSKTAIVLVEAADLAEDAELQAFAELVRQRDLDNGLSPGPISDLLVDGVPAKQWDVEVASVTGETYRLREVVVVRDGIGWRVTLNDLDESFEDNAPSFTRMLRTWRFR